MSVKELIRGKYTIEKVTAEEELDHIDDSLVEFNLSQVPVGPGKDFMYAFSMNNPLVLPGVDKEVE